MIELENLNKFQQTLNGFDILDTFSGSRIYSGVERMPKKGDVMSEEDKDKIGRKK